VERRRAKCAGWSWLAHGYAHGPEVLPRRRRYGSSLRYSIAIDPDVEEELAAGRIEPAFAAADGQRLAYTPRRRASRVAAGPNDAFFMA